MNPMASLTHLRLVPFGRRIVASVLTATGLIGTLVATVSGTSTASVAEPDFAAISAYIDTQRKAERIPGLAVAIVGGDGTVYLAGFGTADATGRPVASNTPFILGSTSKSFTALAIMQLVEAGRVKLDAPVRQYLPWFAVADEKASAEITVRMLLNQTSGLSTAAGRRTLTDFSSGDDALENRVRALRSVRLTAPVGSTYQYSNCNYQILGLIIQQVTGGSYETYMAEHVFAPLAMARTYTSKASALENGLATGHRTWFGRPVEFDETLPRASVPQGFIISTAQDMSHYLIAQLNGGVYGDATVLSADGIAQLHHGAAREGDSDVQYGMGWNVGSHDGINAVWHEGDTNAYQSFMVLLPDARWGLVLLSNVNNIPATQRFEEIGWGIANLLTGGIPKTEHVRDSVIAYAVFVGLVVVQLLGMARTAALLARWRREPSTRPAGLAATIGRIGLPSAANLLWGLLVFVWLPMQFAPVEILTWAAPDIGYLLLFSGLIALAWSAIRATLVYRALHQ
jgi:CubicO group peptidase (beta-lactamase class C family)